MLAQILNTSLQKDLNKLKDELNAYGNEADIWKVQGGISNSAGNLCLHLIGNLNHFIGATLGDTGYVRNRDNEFALKNVPRNELINSIEQTSKVIEKTLASLSDEDLAKTFPIKVLATDTTTGAFLVHLATHFSYHLGQINYHRRLIG